MLNSLSINNIVIIDKANIEFGAGLCVLSGETGSGKSILLDALGLAIGFRSNSRLIGANDGKSQVIAEFDIEKNDQCQKILAENDLLDDENPHLLRIRRSIQLNSQKNVISKNIVNDIAIGANLLGLIGETLIEIHGQHDQRGLLNPSAHGTILDEFAQNQKLLQKIKNNYAEIRETENKIAELKAKKEQSEREKDYLEHVIKELENANIVENEEDELINKKNQLSGKEKLLNFISELRSNLLEADSQLIMAQKILIRNQNIIDNYLPDSSDEFSKFSDIIDQQNGQLDSINNKFDNITNDISNSDDNLEEIEERLFTIRNLGRKYNLPIDELPTLITESQEKLKLINSEETLTHNLEDNLKNLVVEYQKLADQLDKTRRKSAKILSQKVEEELKFLKMGEVKFIIDIQNIEAEADQKIYFSAKGYNKIRFLASLNQNNPDDISKIASGGELSRFMLALKVSLMNIHSTPTIIFDEIDSGIGGKTADAVGNRLKNLAQNIQILVVTHQPQIAAKSDNHFKISKTNNDSKVKTIIENLDNKKREEEVARMLSGENITTEAIAAAKKLF